MIQLTEKQIARLVADANDPEGVLAALEQLTEKKIIATLRAAMVGESEQNWRG